MQDAEVFGPELETHEILARAEAWLTEQYERAARHRWLHRLVDPYGGVARRMETYMVEQLVRAVQRERAQRFDEYGLGFGRGVKSEQERRRRTEQR